MWQINRTFIQNLNMFVSNNSTNYQQYQFYEQNMFETWSLLDDAHLKIAKIYIKGPWACPMNFIGDFNVDMLNISPLLKKTGILYETL
jgi:hypothetical protein